jgi:bifunctional DNase/RNase
VSALPGNGSNGAARRRRSMLDMKVSQLTVDPLSNIPIVILKDVASGTEAVPIWIGIGEASAIAAELEQIALERPMAHDLMKNIIGEIGATVDRIEVHDFRDDIFYASIFLVGPGGKQIRVDARPSDALALALRTGARICVARKVIDGARKIDKRANRVNPDERLTRALIDAIPSPGILEHLADEDFGKWKM